jgi:hypothetical protein
MGEKQMSNIAQVVRTLAESEEVEQFRVNARDFISARDRGASTGTQIAQMAASLTEATQVLNRSFAKEEGPGRYTNVISPVVAPKDSRSFFWLFVAFFFLSLGVMGLTAVSVLADALRLTGSQFSNVALAFFGPHYWLIWLGYVALSVWHYSHVMVPDGCQALITKFGKVEETVGPGRRWIFHPRKKVSYIVNTTREYPYNAPIRQAPTRNRVDASVDLFLQFRIEDANEFIFRLGGVTGFSEKLHNAISEVTRSLIYEQDAEAIYDLVGESTQSLLESLNSQFLPAVRFVNANITHAEPASQEYRMDLAAAEVVKVAKDAYTYQYELQLRKSQDEGEINKELAVLRETLSDIRATIADYQAQIDTAREKAVNRANAYARQLMIEAESEARANAALFKAQSLDIKAVNSASFPELLEYRYRHEVLNAIETVAERLPQVVNVGPAADHVVDFMALTQQMLGISDKPLYSAGDLEAMRRHMGHIARRIRERSSEIKPLTLITTSDEENRVLLPTAVGTTTATLTTGEEAVQ